MKPDSVQDRLVDGLRSNQEWAFRQLHDAYSANLLKYLLRIVKDQAEAKDLVKETFIKVWQNITSYEAKQGKFSTWILRITHNNALDHIRGRKMLCSLDPDYQPNLPAYTPTYDYVGVTKLVTHWLSPKQQQVIDLLYFQGYTMQETAVYLDIPLGTVKTRSRLAIQRLRPIFLREPESPASEEKCAFST